MLTILYVLIGLLLIQSFMILIKGPNEIRMRWAKITVVTLFILAAVMLLCASKPDPDEWYTLGEIRVTLDRVISTKVRKIDRRKIDVPAVALAMYTAQNQFRVPGLLLIPMGFYESKYLTSAIGDQGKSQGILQMGKMGRRRCRDHCGDMRTEHEQIMCGGCWLRENITWCKTLQRGLNGYAGGKCKAIYASTKNAVQRRFTMWYNLHDEVRRTR